MSNLTHHERVKLKKIEEEIKDNEQRHFELLIELAVLKRKELGQTYRFQNSHEHT